MSEDGFPSESSHRRRAQGQVEGFLEKARVSRRDVGNLESLLTTCVHWQALVSV